MPPTFGDDLYFASYYAQNNWDVWKIAKSDFETFKFYRIIGNAVIFGFYYLLTDFPKVMYAIITVLLLFAIYLYSRLFEFVLNEKSKDNYTLFILIFLSVPFSFYIILYRNSISVITSYYLIALCIWLTHQACLQKKPIIFLLIAAMMYGLSLFNYEVSLLMFFYFIFLLFVNQTKSGINKSGNIIFIASLLLVFFIYIYSQLLYIGNQPKLTMPVPGYFINQEETTLWMQLIRKFLYFIYYIKWSYLYTYASFKQYNLFTIIAVGLSLSIGGYLSWKLLCDLNRDRSIKYEKLFVTHGIIFFLCSFGVWSYYWFIKKLFITPPLYHIFLPAIGISLAMVGLLKIMASWIQRSSVFRVILCFVLFSGIMTNMFIFLASRTAIAQTHAEAKNFAEIISELTSNISNNNRYSSIVLLDMPPESVFARYKTRFSESLKYYLSKKNKTWVSVKVVGTKVVQINNRTYKIYPGGKIAPREDVLILRYKKMNSLYVVPAYMVSKEVLSDSQDPFMITFGKYKLYCSNDNADMILETN